MENSIQYLPRVEGGRIWVPHNSGERAFARQSAGPAGYRDTGKRILQANQQVPIGDYTASLLHVAYGCTEEAKKVMGAPEFCNVREIMGGGLLWVFNKLLWTEKGLYAVPDIEATGRSKILAVNDLEERLKGGKELNWGGIRFSQDGRVRFAPKGSYKSLVKDGVIIAVHGKEGADKLGEVSAYFGDKPCIEGIEVLKRQAPDQRVSAVRVDDGRFYFSGIIWDDGYPGHAFGELDSGEVSTQKK